MMKRILYLAAVIFAVMAIGCTKQVIEEPAPEPAVYTLRFQTDSMRLLCAGSVVELTLVNTNEEGDPVNVREDLTVSLSLPGNYAALTSQFNGKWASACETAPASLYTLGSSVIKAGTSSTKVKVSVDVDKIRSSSYSKAFVLPLGIKSGSPSIKSHDIRFVVIPTYSKNSAGRTLVHFSSAGAYLEMYYTDQINDKAMIFCPGGGYSVCNDPVASHYQGNRIAVGVLWYTLPINDLLGRYDLTTQDAFDAIDILHANADRWGGYTKVGTAGRSAGGHLAASTAVYYPQKVDFQILLYAVINMDISKTHEGSVYQFLGDYKTPELVDKYTVYKHVGPDTPRAFITWCKDDSTVPQMFNCAAMKEAMELAGASVTSSVHETGGHATGPDYPKCVLDWLKTF